MLVYIINTVSNSNGYSTMLPSNRTAKAETLELEADLPDETFSF